MTDTAPRRIQRRRTKGWRLPENTVYVGRGTRWGNPWKVTRLRKQKIIFEVGRGFELSSTYGPITAAEAVEYYRELVTTGYRTLLHGRIVRDLDLEPLRGKNLACWCPLDEPCHADVLLEIANA